MGFPYRQVHLDFHTSPYITGVGANFDPAVFVATLQKAHVNSITIFAKDHHGMSYYPTEIGIVHPELQCDLMGKMLAACHEAGIRAPLYVSVCLDEYAAATHMEWRQIHPRTGMPVGAAPLEAGWRRLCLNTEYRHYVLAQIRELLRLYPRIDGLFLDIVMQVEPGCLCNHCLRDMQEQHLRPDNEEHLRFFSLQIQRHFMKLVHDATHSKTRAIPLFFNSRLRIDDVPEAGMPGEEQWYSHWEIESLPTGGWGYNHFPLFARYFQTKDKPMSGHTGRFHRSWGDFGGLKPKAALEYECFRMLAAGARCCIGDQMHPSGKLDPAVYELIGQVYAQVEQVEPWCVDTAAQAEIGLLAWPTGKGRGPEEGISARGALEGALRMLLETHQQFQVLDRSADYSRYKLLIAPDVILMDEELRDKVKAYLAAGGALILSYESGLDPAKKAFALEEIGLKYWGAAEYAPSYMGFEGLQGPLVRDIAPMPHVVYEPGIRVTLQVDTKTIIPEIEPYFNRTWDHFCSHRQTPPRRQGQAPMVTQRGKVVYIARPLFNEYHRHANRVWRLLVRNLIEQFLPQPLVRLQAPSSAEVTLLRQPAAEGRAERYVAHLLCYFPERRGEGLDIIEEVVPLPHVELAVRLGKPIKRAYLAPQEQDLVMTSDGPYVKVTVPELRGHQLVVFE